MRLFRVAVVAGVFVYFTGSSQASTTYTYTGTNYVNIVDATPPSGSYTTSMNVTGSVTLTNALGPNSPLQFINDVETFSFSDGRILYTPQNSSVAIFFLATNAADTISRWDIELRIGGDPNGPHAAGDQGASLFVLFGISVDDNDRARFAQFIDPTHDGLDAADSAVGHPGTWAATPATGLGALGLLGWRRKRNNTV
ncbi:MAG TPA: hypothetical protein VHT68_22895 [Pseudolabrys sp.]|nr:hypothetical protein [Pseudolabrys sp.]